MSLDGLRAWIGEVERKLGIRTRVFLVLTVIAVGAAAAGIYLAVDARNKSVSESDVQALQKQLETRIGEASPGGGTGLSRLEAEVRQLKAEVEELKGTSKQGKGANGTAGKHGSGSAPTSGSSGIGTRTLNELLSEAKRRVEQAK